MFKRMVSVLIAISMMLSLCSFTTVSASTAYEWNFNTDGDKESWVANKGTTAVLGGVMTHTVKAGQNNAFLQSPKDLTIDGSQYKYVKIRLKNSNCASSACIVSFITDTDTNWDKVYSSGTKSVVTATGITGYDSDYTEYVIDMSANSNWTNGTVTRIRVLTFLNSTSITAGSMDIDYIKVDDTLQNEESTPTVEPTTEPTQTPAAEETVAPTDAPSDIMEMVWNFNTDGDKEGWLANKGTLAVLGGVMTHTVSAGQSNAFLLSPKDLAIDGSKYKYVKIRLKNNNCASSTCVVSFITDTDSAWDTLYSTGTKSVMTPNGITGYDSDYTEYIIDMSSNSNWTNGTVTRMRVLTFLNTASVTAGSMDIDYIKVDDVPESVIPDPIPTPEPTPQPTPTPEPSGKTVEVSTEGADSCMVGSYIVINVKTGTEVADKIEIYEGENLISEYSGGGPVKHPYELTRTGTYTFSAKAYYGEESIESEKVIIPNVKTQRPQRGYGVRYTFDEDTEGFIQRDDYCEIEQSNGALEFDIEAANAYMYKSGISIDLSKGKYVIVKMKNNSDGSNFVLQWKTAEDNTFSEDKKVTFKGVDSNGTPITTDDSEYKEYVFYMGDKEPWADKTLTYLQIYPAGNATSGTVYIDEILFSDMQKDVPDVSEFNISSNANSGLIIAGNSLKLSAQITKGTARKIEFYNTSTLLGEATQAPYEITYAANMAEEMQITALLYDEYGTIVKSDNTLNVSVKYLYEVSSPIVNGTEISIKAVQNTNDTIHNEHMVPVRNKRNSLS